VTCKRCGTCCVNNGLIPPLLYGVNDGDDDKPEWLKLLVHRLRRAFGDVAEDHPPCIFLTEDNRCAIQKWKPAICAEFRCGEQ